MITNGAGFGGHKYQTSLAVSAGNKFNAKKSSHYQPTVKKKKRAKRNQEQQ
jgi:hypothetical protein